MRSARNVRGVRAECAAYAACVVRVVCGHRARRVQRAQCAQFNSYCLKLQLVDGGVVGGDSGVVLLVETKDNGVPDDRLVNVDDLAHGVVPVGLRTLEDPRAGPTAAGFSAWTAALAGIQR